MYHPAPPTLVHSGAQTSGVATSWGRNARKASGKGEANSSEDRVGLGADLTDTDTDLAPGNTPTPTSRRISRREPELLRPALAPRA